MKKSTHGDRYEDDGILFECLDFEGLRLRVRVGPVYDNKHQEGYGHPEKAIWIEIGNEDFLMSHETFMSLYHHVHRRFDEWKQFGDSLDKAEQIGE